MKYKHFFKSIILVLGVQAVMYFIAKLLLTNYHTMNTIISFKLVKEMVYVYNSWYPFVFFTSFLVYKYSNNYNKFISTMIIGIILSYITFIIYPTIVVRPDIIPNTITNKLLYITYYLDTPATNCLPSIHCLFSFILMYYISTTNIKTIYKILINIYFILIVLSTVFTHQHIIEDAILSLIYTIISIFITYKFNTDKYIKNTI